MAHPSIVPEILEKLEPWLEARMAEFQSQSEIPAAGRAMVCMNEFCLWR